MTIIDRRYSVAEGTAVKAPCRAATTANITLSGLQTIDGIALVEHDRVLVKDQTTGSENGIYEASSGNWLRAKDFDGAYDIVTGTRVFVTGGVSSFNIEYVVSTTGSITIGTTAIAFVSSAYQAVTSAAAAAASASAASTSSTSAATSATSASSSSSAAVAAAASVVIASAADRTALKALDTTITKSALLRESGREGTFVWTTGNFATLVTADTQEGIYIKANAIASSSGAWVRVRDDEKINVSWFGSAGYTAASAALSLAGTIGKGTVVFADVLYDLTNNVLTVPNSINVQCSPTTVIRRSLDISGAAPYGVYTGSMISLGSYCKWSGGVLDNTAVLTTSTTSNTIGSIGTKTFTVGASLGLTTSSFLRVYSRANPANHYEGTVNSYSGTTLVLNASFASGSGTYSDWDVCQAGVYQCPMVLHGTSNSVVENVRLTGKWYVGMMMDGWNPSTGGTLSVSKCVFRNCYAESVQNRGFYLYGTCSENVIDTCFVAGSNGVTDYGFNMNSANATGTVNSQQWNKIVNCTATGVSFQGFEVGDICLYNIISNCTVIGITSSSGYGYLVQTANSQTPQFNKIIGCVASGCAGYGYYVVGSLYMDITGCTAVTCSNGFVVGPLSATQSQFVALNSCTAVSNTSIGFWCLGNSTRCSFNDVNASGNAVGVQIDSGVVRSLVTGRSNTNSGANITDNGTSSVTTGLTTA